MALTFEGGGQRPVEASVIGVGLIIVPPRDPTTNIPWTGDLEIERAPDASGSPGTWVPIATIDHVPPAGGRYIDTDPLTAGRWTTAIWWYRYRLTRGGATGGYSAPRSVTSGLFPRGTRAGLQAGDAAAFYGGLRSEPLSDEKYAVVAADAAGIKADRTVGVDGAVRTLYTALTWLLPNGEFEVWQSASQPHGWTVDTGDSSVAAKDTGVVFSGDAAAKFSFGSGGSAATWRGLATNDPTKGAQCVPLRPGFRYRIIAASRVSTLTGAPKYRLKVQYDAGGTLTASREFTYRAATTYQRDEWVLTVPAAAEPNTKVWIEFQRNDTNAKDYWADSIRFEEEVASLAEQAALLASQGTSFALNGYFEEGTAYWRQTSGGSLFKTTAAPPDQGTAGAILTVGSSTHRVQQCDRSTDLVDSAEGNPIYIPVNPFDEIWGSIAFGTTSATSAGSTWRFGVEEYAADKALIQRQYIGSGSIVQSTTTILRGGGVLSSTTKYIVAIIEVLPAAGYDGVTIKFDALNLFWNAARRRCLAYKSAAVQSLTSGTETAVTFDVEAYDVGALHDTGANTTRITVPAEMVGRGGIRLVGQVSFAANATGSRRLRWKKNNTTFLAEVRMAAFATDATVVQCVARDEMPAATDYYELFATQNSGGALNALNGTRAVTFGEAIHDY